jgi:hypothetical protein
MKNLIALYVPSTVNVDRPVDTAKYVNLVAKLFSVWFGGATIENKQGCYLSDSGKLVNEPITRVYSFVETLDEQTKARVIGVANLIKTRLSQESVAIELIEYPTSEGMLFV